MLSETSFMYLDLISLGYRDIMGFCIRTQESLFSLEDIKEALKRRGPDSLGSKKVILHSKIASSVGGQYVLSCAQGEEATTNDFLCNTNACQCITSESEEPCLLKNGLDKAKCVAELCFIGATLQLRGVNPIVQPLLDTFGNILVYNGMFFLGFC